MPIFHSIILGAVEGLTEFIPVSSSGHLIIAHYLLGDAVPTSLAFDAIVQSATILAVALYFWRDLWHLVLTFFQMISGKAAQVAREQKILLYAIILGTIPAGVAGLVLEHPMETIFRSVSFVAVTLILGSFLMMYAEYRLKKQQKGVSENGPAEPLTVRKGVIVGLYQILALAPGISRSGATISGGLIQGLGRSTATRFSFLLAFPIILGAGLKKLYDVAKIGGFHGMGSDILIGSTVAFVVGLLSIHFLIKYLRTRSLYPFIWYRIIVAILLLAFFAK